MSPPVLGVVFEGRRGLAETCWISSAGAFLPLWSLVLTSSLPGAVFLPTVREPNTAHTQQVSGRDHVTGGKRHRV